MKRVDFVRFFAWVGSVAFIATTWLAIYHVALALRELGDVLR